MHLLFHEWTLLGWLCCLFIVASCQRTQWESSAEAEGKDDSGDVWKSTGRGKQQASSPGANANLCPKPRFQNGRVKIRSRGRVAKFVCNSNYEIVGKRFLTCIRGHWSSAAPVCVVHGCMMFKSPSNGRVMESYKGAFVLFDCDPGYVLDGARALFCNGVIWNGTAPTCRPYLRNPSLMCDFETEDLCGWKHDLTCDFEWERHNFGTPSGHVGTGPSHDHTKGEGADGSYMYIEASSPRKENDTARFLSPVYSPAVSQNTCFSFWYHMYGGTTGYLKVYVKPESKSIQDVAPYFQKAGDQGNRWLLGRFPIPLLNENFQIIIEGIRGTSYVGDTAIDDVKISSIEDCYITEETSTNAAEGSSTRNISGSCYGRCNVDNPEMEECQCNAICSEQGTCCLDFVEVCQQDTNNNTTSELSSTPFRELTSSEASAPFSTLPSTQIISNFSSVQFPSTSQSLNSTNPEDIPLMTPIFPSTFKTTDSFLTTMMSSPTVAAETNTTQPLPSSLSTSTIPSTVSLPSTAQSERTTFFTMLETFIQTNSTVLYPATTPLPVSTLPPTTRPVTVTSVPPATKPINLTTILLFTRPTYTTVMFTFTKPPKTTILTPTRRIKTTIKPYTTMFTTAQTNPKTTPFLRTTQSYFLKSTMANRTFPSSSSRSVPVTFTSTPFTKTEASTTSTMTVNRTIPVFTTKTSDLPTTQMSLSTSTSIYKSSVTANNATAKTESSRETNYIFTPWPRKPKPSPPTRKRIVSNDAMAMNQENTSNSVIIGAVIGGIVLTCAVACLAVFVYRRRNKQDKLAEDSDVRYLKDGENIEFSEGSQVYGDEL